MSDSQSTAITAIHKAEFESFAAGTLFGQGWSVLHRALDWQSVTDFLESSPELPDVLLCSTDLIGIDLESIEALKSKGIRIFLFLHEASVVRDFPDALPIPDSALELIGLVRGSIRSPLLRNSIPERRTSRARVLGVTSAHSSAGCTTLAINLASELSIAGHRTLLVDANPTAPAVAILIGEQGLHSNKGFTQVGAGFWAMEITQNTIVDSIALLDNAQYEFDFIVIDLGPTLEIAETLRGRRWSGETLVWVSSNADHLWVLAKSDSLSLHLLRKFTQELLRNSIKPEISFIQFAAKSGRRSTASDELFANAMSALGSRAVFKIPLDTRSISIAENAHETLYQSNEKSLLRKSIQGLSGEIKR
ncbi:BY-kinase domain containing protein [Candidatus Nanopelagicaceae bacterium]